MQGSRDHGAASYRSSQARKISEMIQHEIARFESVHPFIYNAYDLVDGLSDAGIDTDIREQLRDQILNIEDSFVNSQEWTLSRSVSDIRLGVVGSIDSGKAALVHYYLTGTYNAGQNDEGGRFKKEIIVNGRSNLMLIREEGGGIPDEQFTNWLDGVLIVFALDSRESFNVAMSFYMQMEQLRVLSRVPVILVGTQDTINEHSVRVVTEEEGRGAALRHNMQSYIETNAAYGVKVDEAFKQAYERILSQRTERRNDGRFQDLPISDYTVGHHQRSMSTHLSHRDGMIDTSRIPSQMMERPHSNKPVYYQNQMIYGPSYSCVAPAYSHSNLSSHNSVPLNAYGRSLSNFHPHPEMWNGNLNDSFDTNSLAVAMSSTASLQPGIGVASTSQLPTPTSTPTTQRKNRRISHLFRSSNKDNNSEQRLQKNECVVGCGRKIPIKQGDLYKKSSKGLNREWKKKYVCLHSDGRLTYHQNLKDYMNKVPGKEVYLGLAAVRLTNRNRPKSKPKPAPASQPVTNGKENMNPPAEDSRPPNGTSTPGDATSGASDDQQQFGLLTSTSSVVSSHQTTPVSERAVPSAASSIRSNVSKKKRSDHRRLSSVGKLDDDDDTEFELITNDQKRWEFSAMSTEDRDAWVAAIEQQIEKSLQAQLSQKEMNEEGHCNRDEVLAIRRMTGNQICADCSMPDPVWASLNLGTLICIECSGIHRNLGSHISKVRSLELDAWPHSYISVLKAIGNELANRVWEHNAPKDRKPSPKDPRAIKENWIKQKYEQKRFLLPVRVDKTLSTQLLEAVVGMDKPALLSILARCSEKDINAPLNSNDRRTVVHLTSSNGSAEILQLLIWYNADVNAVDEKGRSPLWYAEQNAASECREILLAAQSVNDKRSNYDRPTSKLDDYHHHYRHGERGIPPSPGKPTSRHLNHDAFDNLPTSAI